MKRQITQVTYEHPRHGALEVRRLEQEIVVARRVLDLAGLAYGDEFESPRTPANVRLPEGRISKDFSSDNPRLVGRQLRRMQEVVAGGGSYWGIAFDRPSIKDNADNLILDGMIKTTPSHTTTRQRLGVGSPNCYIADICTRPQSPLENDLGVRRQGYGAMLLHSALQEYEPDVKVVADVFRAGQSGQMFFAEDGLAPNIYAGPPQTTLNRGQPNEFSLPMTRYEAQAGSVLNTLEAKYNWLADVEISFEA